MLAEVLITSNTESFHPGDNGANRLDTSLQATSGTYLTEGCPALKHIKLQNDSCKQKSPRLLNLKLFGLYQDRITRGVCFGMTLPGMSHRDTREPSELTQNAEPCLLPVNCLSAAIVAVTMNELLKKEMRRDCLARVAGIFLYGKQGTLMCTMKKKYIPY